MPDDELQRQIMYLLNESTNPTKSFTELAAEFRAAGKPVPPGLAMLDSAEQDGSDDPHIAALQLRRAPQREN